MNTKQSKNIIGENNPNYKGYNIKHPLYQSWKTMKRRCDNPNSRDYSGTTYIESWKIYGNFYNWAIKYWKEKTYLSRIDNNKGFYPENCIFRTKKEINTLKDNNVQKSKQTCIQKYGVDHYTKTKEYKDRVQEISLKKYGVKHHTQSKEVREKIVKTNLEKYGHKCTLSNEKIKEKVKKTNLEKRGVEYPAQDPKVIEKIKQTMQNNGNMYIHQNMNSAELANKIGISRSGMNARIRKYGYELAISTEKKESMIEKLISHELDKLNLSYEKQVKIEDKFADFLIENSIIIETDGLYWHSDKINKDKQYHKKKRQLYIKQGYFPLFFREHEIENKLDICISIIKNKLGLNKKIYARNCDIYELSNKDKKDFFNQNHLMGKGSGRCIALKYKDEIVCAIQFINKKYIDISRFCTKTNISVIGAYSKLLKQIPQKEIRTFVDLRYGSGEYLKQLGFEKKNEDLSFNWTDFVTTYHRMKFPSNTGYEKGLAKIWDCGQALYVKEADKVLSA